jgi:hypothetical protein
VQIAPFGHHRRSPAEGQLANQISGIHRMSAESGSFLADSEPPRLGHHLGHGTPVPLAGQHIRAATVVRHAVTLLTGPGRSSALPVGVSAARTTMRV